MVSVVEVVAPARLGAGFRWLLASSWVSNIGDGIALAAGPLLVASQTDDPFLVAMAALLQRLPWLCFGLVAGAVADRVDRRLIVLTVDLLRAAVLASLAVTISTERVNIAVVLVTMFLLGTAETFADVTTSTLMPMLVAKADYGVANARLMGGVIVANQLAGPPIGAALFAAGAASPFVTQAVCTALAALMVSRLAASPGSRAGDARRPVVHEIVEGIRWLWAHPPMRTLALTIVSFNLTFGAAWSVLVLYATDRLGMGEIGFGLLTTATALGGLVGTGIYGLLTARASLADIMRVGLIIETLTHLALALTTTPWVALVVMFVFGMHAFVWGTTSTTVRQRAVPTGLQGRVGSVYMLGVYGGIVAGGATGGLIASGWGIVAPFWFGFVGSALILTIIWRQLGHIAHADEAVVAAVAR
ncbi:MAG: MFS transporter [Acidimicrobiia bacterium]|nr:MFS transporter [Acidimicrobiia bacterium]